MCARILLCLCCLGLAACPGERNVRPGDGPAGDSPGNADGPGRTDGPASPTDGPKPPKPDGPKPPKSDGPKPPKPDGAKPPKPDACVPTCAGKSCGGNGCGGSCGSCQAWQACQSGACACKAAQPAGWPSFSTWSKNPVVVPSKGHAMEGADNIYAPEIHPINKGWVMWYGGQGKDGHDRIFVATSADGVQWSKWPSGAAPKPALDRGGSNHVNDPSVVKVGGTWYMYYTDAAKGIDDTIWLATGKSLSKFTKVGKVLGPGLAGSWESLKVGRPAVLYEGGLFKLWYDGQNSKARHVGYATSADGKTFTRSSVNPVLKNAGAVDVKKVGGVYVLLFESGTGTYWATSPDGVHCFKHRGKLFGTSGKPYDAFGQVTPFLQLVGGKARAVWFGGASVGTWNKNRVAVAPAVGVNPGLGGCTGCTPAGSTCGEACAKAGYGGHGTCASPGSTNTSKCCACKKSFCASCLGGKASCHVACVAVGMTGGYCAFPGSTNVGKCCGCWL